MLAGVVGKIQRPELAMDNAHMVAVGVVPAHSSQTTEQCADIVQGQRTPTQVKLYQTPITALNKSDDGAQLPAQVHSVDPQSHEVEQLCFCLFLQVLLHLAEQILLSHLEALNVDQFEGVQLAE